MRSATVRAAVARLGVADQTPAAAPQLEQHLRDLGGLARTRLTRDDHHLVVAHELHDVVAPRRDGQLLGVGDVGHRGIARRNGGGCGVEVVGDGAKRLRRAGLVQATAKPPHLGKRQAIEAGEELAAGGWEESFISAERF